MTEREIEFVEDDTVHGRFITFAVEKETYGIEIRFVKEIVGLQPINKLPEAPEHIKGVINLRGKIIPVVDMRLKFKKQAAEYSDRTCILVIDTGDISAGLIVDEVSDVISINDKDISPPPRISAGCGYLAGIGKVNGQVKLLLDCGKLFYEEETKVLNNIEQELKK